MTTFKEQLETAKAAHLGVSALEDVARERIQALVFEWEAGLISNASIRHALEGLVRQSYRASATMAAAQAKNNAGLDNWNPKKLQHSTYLHALLADVRRNLRDYKASDKSDVAKRRLVSRIQHSAGVAAQRGYTDSIISSYSELEDMGYDLSKVWLANFINNVPCPHCTKLHGTVVGLHDTFPVPTKSSAVYIDLQGPPRHPRCRCYIAVLIHALDNVNEEINIDNPNDTLNVMDTNQIKKLSLGTFTSMVLVLKKTISSYRKKKN